MKKLLITLLLPLLAVTLSYAQTAKPAYGKKMPNQIRLLEERTTGQQQEVLKEKLQLTETDALKSLRISTDELGITHEKFQQFYKGVKVEGGTYTVHSKNGVITLLTGDFIPVDELNAEPSISETAAFDLALAHVDAKLYAWEPSVRAGFPDYEKPRGELVVVSDLLGRSPARLAYKFDIYAADPVYRAYVFIDAHNGTFIRENLRIHETNTPASGTAIYNGSVSFTADFTGSNYRLRQTSSGGGVQTYNLNNGTSYNNATDFTSSSSNFTSDGVGVQAHWGAEQVHAYFFNEHNRNSYNGTGGVLRSYVHYSNNYVNAFWDGSRMTYGDGDGVNYGPLVSLDICGHEISHGVTEYTANLVYSYESGALNESFSDIFGEAIENYATGSNDWLMGDQIGAGGSGGAIRSLSNPKAFGDPDTYQGTYWYSGSGDNGGVHINSGVQNKWFYILSVGESGTNDQGESYSVSGIGLTNAARIAYRNLSVYLSSNSNYAAARAGAIQAARDLFGPDSPEEIATTDAWYAVGVGNAYGPPPPCVTDQVELNITLDNYPGETTWNLKNGSGTTIASGGPYSGAGSTVYQAFNLTPGDYTFTINDSYGDGICCGYGQGSYSLTSGSTTIANGGAFGSSESTGFCFDGTGDTEPPTVPGNLSTNNITQSSVGLSWTASSDNVGVAGYRVYVDGVEDGTTTNLTYTASGLTANTNYQFDVAAYDAAGNESGPASTNASTLPGGGGGGNTILAHYFESGWDGWSDGGADCARYSGNRSYEGNYSIQLRDNSGTASAMTSSAYNVSSYNQLTIEFYFYSYSMENGEDLWVRYYDGSSWQTVAAYAAGTSFTNNSFWVATIELSSANHNFPTNARFRFQCDASANNDLIYIDAVTVTGANTLMAGQDLVNIRPLTVPGKEQAMGLLADEHMQEAVLIFPNPVRNTLQIRSPEAVRSLRLFTASGLQVRDMPGFEGNYDLDMNNLAPGMYFLALETPAGMVHKRVIKQ